MSDENKPRKPGAPNDFKRKNMMDKAVRESMIAREREERMRELRAIFSNYGHQVMTHVTSQFIRYGHLKNTLKMMGLNQPPEFAAQRDLLLRYLEQTGTRGLIQKLSGQANLTPIPDAKEAQPEPAPEPQDEVADQILDEAESRLMERVLHSRSRKKGVHEHDTQISKIRAEDDTATDPNSPRHRKKSDREAEICPRTGRPMLDGEYIERRSGQDRRISAKRRTGKDRRSEVEVIYQNKRFGKNRRTSKDRRSGHDRRQNP